VWCSFFVLWNGCNGDDPPPHWFRTLFSFLVLPFSCVVIRSPDRPTHFLSRI
jgi:hypothetical protein